MARFAGTAAAVEYQLARAGELIDGRLSGARVEARDEDGELWSGLSAFIPKSTHGLAWCASVLPSGLGALLSKLEDEAGRADELMWHAGAGDGRLRVFDEVERGGAETLKTLRSMRDATRDAGGSLVIERASSELRREFGAWGLTESAALLMRRVKEQLDPDDIFSPGRFAWGER